jgi:hypothetical protein
MYEFDLPMDSGAQLNPSTNELFNVKLRPATLPESPDNFCPPDDVDRLMLLWG